MILDKKGKLFGKLSIVDACVILLIIGILAGTYYRFRSPVATAISGGDSDVLYSVKIQDVRDFSADYYMEGLNAYDSKTDTYIGKIQSVSIAPFFDRLEKADGTIVKAEKPGKIEITLEIAAKGLETDQSYLVEGTYELRVGAGIYLSTMYVDVNGIVDGISIINQ